MYELDGTWCQYYKGYLNNPPVDLLNLNWFCPDSLNRNFAYPNSTGQLHSFSDMRGWYDYVQSLRIPPIKVCLPYVDAFDDALRSLLMSYFLSGFCKLAENKALSTLEGAIKEAYMHRMCEPKKVGRHKCAGLGSSLDWIAKNDGFRPELADNTVGQRLKWTP